MEGRPGYVFHELSASLRAQVVAMSDIYLIIIELLGF